MDSKFLWWRDGIIYQIYPRSFCDSNQDGIGDLNGITSKLDYLAELGIDAIWLSPIYPSPDVDFGYDVSDYCAIDPKFGTMADFDCLLAEAHKRNIHLIMDLVLNHTSDQHAWFKESRSSRDNPYRDWYLWRDPSPKGGCPNNWQSCFGGSGWEYDSKTGQCYFHMFYKEQPDLNWRNPAVRQALLDVFRFWLDKGVDGFRLDVFNAYFKDSSFKDNPPAWGLRGFNRQNHVYDTDQPEMYPLLAEIREIVDDYPEKYIVGETFMSTPEKAAQYVGKNRLHAAFNFKFQECKWNAGCFFNVMQRWQQVLGEENWPNYVLNNHDVRRSATRYGRGEDDERLKVAATMLLTLQGTPFLYYGEEIGMRDIPISRNEIQDPVGKHYWPFFKGRDGCRSPMQWDQSTFSGFSTALPWLKLHQNYSNRNVAIQQDDPNSLLNFYIQLIKIRKSHPALQNGMFISLTYDPQTLLGYLRQNSGQTILVGLNFSRKTNKLVLSGSLLRSGWELLISNKRSEIGKMEKGCLVLEPEEALVMIQKE